MSNIMNTFGYSEMYEWANYDNVNQFGRFVQLSTDPKKPHCVDFATNPSNIIGVSSANAAFISDNPSEWFLKYLFNEYGDIYIKEDTIAVAEKKYDTIKEISYIETKKQDVYNPIVNEKFDNTKNYTLRTNRNEWVKVNLIGKCIVQDNGKCVNGGYCKLYNGFDKNLFGTAIPATEQDPVKWRILNRVSEKTILIFFK